MFIIVPTLAKFGYFEKPSPIKTRPVSSSSYGQPEPLSWTLVWSKGEEDNNKNRTLENKI
ncbi:hypothetical protein OUZ56_002954 [Daphnia magna]|uniref:Uncharacterized protein n=1 Tax=Daphnia magna TaxID=35525 RepID=A0ABR0A7A6_9CRUS|nr:hypothetical protein OUZ56_002954 [Daphnia magna]